MKHIVVLGSGFGGIYTVKYLLQELKHAKDVKITLISKDNYFLFTPMLHEVATGGLNRHNIVEPVRNLFHADNFEFVKCTVKTIRADKKIIETTLCDIPYDYLVIALGSTTNFFHVPGADQYCLDLKNISAAAAVRNRIINSLEIASKLASSQNIQPYLNFTVVGAGPTGVELAAEIVEFVRQMLRNNYKHLRTPSHVYLLQRGDTIMPHAHPRVREQALHELQRQGVTVRLHSEVTKVFKDSVELNKKERLPTHTVIWTSGVKPTPMNVFPSVVDERGFFQVNSYLQVEGLKDVFALGDCAYFVNPGEQKPVPALAQTATLQAKMVARNIIHALRRESLEIAHIRLSGFLVSVGQKFAVADLHGIRFSGFFAWWLWRTIYLFKLLGWTNKFRVALDWTINLFSKRDTSQI